MTDIFESSSKTPNKQRRSVSFSKVEVYYFDRAQGFICVPSQGGSTLGMQAVHWASEEFSVNSHQHLRLLERYAFILRKCKNGKLLLDPDQVSYLEKTIRAAPEPILSRIFGCWPRHGISFFDSLMCSQTDSEERFGESSETETKFYPPHSTRVQLTGIPLVRRSQSVDSDITEAEDERLSGVLDCYFLPLLSIKKRRILLRRAGLKTVDPAERIECQAIRISRDVCGCNCPDGVCLPTLCNCALNGIKCQVDRVNFPCHCTSPARCQNPEGRIEFNPIRVRTHYLHTRMRLDIEQRDRRVTEPWNDGSHHDAKRPRLENYCSSKHETSTADDQVYGRSLHEATDACNSHGDSHQPLFNTTVNGGCRDCEDEHYMHLLMQEFVNQTEDPELQTSEANPVTPSALATHSVELGTVTSHHTTDLPSEDTVVPIANVASYQTCSDLVSPELVPYEPIINQEQTLSIFPTETEEGTTQQTTESMIYPSQGLTKLEVYTDSVHSSFDGHSLLSRSFELNSCAEVPLSIPDSLASTEPDHVHSQFTFPFSKPDEVGLLIMDNHSDKNEAISTNHSNALGKCTLEPISSLFASCSTVTPADPVHPENATVPPSAEITLEETLRTTLPYRASSTNHVSDLVCSTSTTGVEPTNSSLDGVTVSVTGNSISTPLFDARSKCSEPDNSPRNSTPPSSPYMESVRA